MGCHPRILYWSERRFECEKPQKNMKNHWFFAKILGNPWFSLLKIWLDIHRVPTRLPRGMSPPGRRLHIREANNLRGISPAQSCWGRRQSKRISNEQKSKIDEKKRVPESCSTGGLKLKTAGPCFGSLENKPYEFCVWSRCRCHSVNFLRNPSKQTDKQTNASFLESGLLD